MVKVVMVQVVVSSWWEEHVQKGRRQDLPFKENGNRFLNGMFGEKTMKRATVEKMI